MRAVLCREHGPAERLVLVDDWPMPVPGPREVLIAVRAAGLNFPDVLVIEGKYQIQPDLPFVPGSECAGEVVALGEDVSRWRIGDKVIAMAGHGCFSEHVAVDENAVSSLPPGLDFVRGAGVAMTYFTSWHALRQRAELEAGETLLVLGAGGGVGSTAVELGHQLGARVVAAASSDEKLALCRDLGASETINYREQDLRGALKELTGGRGVDVVYDPVGGDLCEPALRSMAWKGRYLVVGFASGTIPKVPLNLALLKGCSIVGVFWGRFSEEEPALQAENVQELWRLFSEGRLRPAVNDVFPLERYLDAYTTMTGRRARGKVVLTL